ncbi:MAG: sigma 54-interacting transcriptional regulator [Pseudomonadales bacterium]
MWVNGTNDKVNILVVGYRKFSQIMNTVAPEFEHSARIKIVDYVFEKDVPIVDLVEHNNADIVVSAGANAAYLKATLSVPVDSLDVSKSDLIDALLKARTIGKRILTVTYEMDDRLLDLVGKMIDAEISHKRYSTPNEVREIFYLSEKSAFDVVIGSSYVCELAEKNGMKGILVYSKDSCRELINKAISTAKSTRKTAEQDAINGAIFEGASTPMVIANIDGRALHLNRAAQRELNVHSNAEKEHLAGLLAGQKEALPITLNEGVWYVNRSPILVNAQQQGLVYHLTGEVTRRRISQARSQRSSPARNYFVYGSSQMGRLHQVVKNYASNRGTVLITGETGSGKELIAREIYKHSAYADGEFVAINCGAIPEELFESEMFGYVDGAFTNSRRGGRTGLLQTANKGVFFLDEISELPLTQQAKILRVLQERQLRPVGSDHEVAIDVKFICASNRLLEDCVNAGTFREDLYYRINVFSIKLPGLRRHKEDIPLIAAYFADKYQQQYDLDLDVSKFIKKLNESLKNYHWPGNVRELENIIERLVVSHSSFENFADFNAALPDIVPEWFTVKLSRDSHREEDSGVIKNREQQLIREAMEKFAGNKTKVAEYLGISPTTLWRRLKTLL